MYDLMISMLPHAIHKSFCQTESITAFPLGTSVDNENIHPITRLQIKSIYYNVMRPNLQQTK